MFRYSTEPGSPSWSSSSKATSATLIFQSDIERLCDDLELNGKSRIVEVIRHFTGMEPKAVWTDVKLGLPLPRR